MNIINIIRDMCIKYPAFSKKDSEIQVVPYNENTIYFFFKNREFKYDTTVGVLQMLYSGTIENLK
jgi:hypothetical protein